jgi:hypothetical protein
MLYLIVGIVLGAAFHEFWHELFQKCRNKVNQWTAGDNVKSGSYKKDNANKESTKKDGDVMEGEVVEPETESSTQQKQAPQS